MSGGKPATFCLSLFAGVVFGVGLAISGMANPRKVLGFLDVAGEWDPSLAFVMAGAVGVTAIATWRARSLRSSWMGEAMPKPVSSGVDRALILGAILFGLGWGLVGLCPGPALASLGLAARDTWLFVAAMAAGVLLHQVLNRRAPSPN